MTAASILLVTRNLPPLKGGVERLMQHTVDQLSRGYACDVLGPVGCRIQVPAARKVWELPPALPWFHLRALPRLLAARGYDLVVAGNGLVAPLARIAALRSGCPYAVFVHGLDIVVDHSAYRRFFLPSICNASIVIANSRHTAGLAEQHGVPASRTCVINPGVELPAKASDSASFRTRHGLAQRRILLSVGRLVPRKGLAEFVESALPLILKACPDCCLVIVGDEPMHAVGRNIAIRRAVEQAAQRARVAEAVRFLGSVDDQELADAYAAAEVFVFPVLKLPGDVEGFGMVALEAAAHGLPTIAFNVGGVADAVRDRQTGLMIASGDYQGFSDSVIHLLRHSETRAALENAAATHAASRSWAYYGDSLRRHLERLL